MKSTNRNKLKKILNSFIKNNCTLSNEQSISLLEIVSFYESTSDEDRGILRATLSNNDYRNTLILSDLFAYDAINFNKVDYLRIAMVFHSIEDFNWAPRENLIRLSIIWYISEKINVDPIKLFKDVSSISSNKTSNYLNDFINRPKNLKTLNAFGLIVQKEGSNYSFIPKPPPWQRK